MKKAIERLIIVNRGEIAVRIIRTAKRMGIHTIAVYSDADQGALHTRLADEQWPLGSNDLAASYLDIPKLMDIAKRSRADALHPGYGFLAENPNLVKACEQEGILFIGPGIEAMQLMGNKIQARKFVKSTGAPLVEGFTGTPKKLLANADLAGFPYLVKAAAGGGGKGMRIARNPSELEQHLETSSREALKYFGEGTVFLERFLEDPRHIEIQILADKHGNVIHLFERECSVQRRYQKIIEEAPSPGITADMRQKMGATAVSIAKAIGYVGAGTMEFLVDNEGKYFFLEMNTRIQVEHPVTEMITGIDIVREQIHIAEGLPLSFRQEDIQFSGHAIEFRIYAEDAMNDFMPSPGRISFYQEPSGAGIRVDSAIDGEADIHGFYDPMISKLVVYGNDRETALRKGREALLHYTIHGIQTNIPLLYLFTQLDDFRENRIHTRYCDVNYEALKQKMVEAQVEHTAGAVIICYLLSQFNPKDNPANVWERIGYWRQMMEIPLQVNGQPFLAKIEDYRGALLRVAVDGKVIEGKMVSFSPNELQVMIGDAAYQCRHSCDDQGFCHLSLEGNTYQIERRDELSDSDFYIPPDHAGTSSGALTSPMPGKVLKVNVTENQQVSKGQILVVVEAMKMENNILATFDGTITEVNVKAGDSVDTKRPLVIIGQNTKE